MAIYYDYGNGHILPQVPAGGYFVDCHALFINADGEYLACINNDNLWLAKNGTYDSLSASAGYFAVYILQDEKWVATDGLVVPRDYTPIWSDHIIKSRKDYSVVFEPATAIKVDSTIVKNRERSFQLGLTFGLCGEGVVEAFSVLGTTTVLESSLFNTGYKTGAELRRLRKR